MKLQTCTFFIVEASPKLPCRLQPLSCYFTSEVTFQSFFFQSAVALLCPVSPLPQNLPVTKTGITSFRGI